jgi:hypothetical protein
MISFVVIIAPFVFIFFRWGEIKEDKETKKVVYYEGYLVPFLVSCAITLFAGLAQLVILFLLLDEAFREYRFWYFLLVVQSALGLSLWLHAGRSMFLTIELQVAANEAAENAVQKANMEADAKLKAIGSGTDENTVAQSKEIEVARRKKIEDAKRPLLTWSVL